MLTKNWYNGLMAVLTGKTYNLVTYNNSTGYTVDASIGTSWLKFNSGKSTQYPYIGYVTKLTDVGGVIFGKGTTQPTINDYKLSGSIVNVSASSNVALEATDNEFILKSTHVIHNTSDSEITISEVGLIASLGSYNNSDYKCLLEHTLLDTPVTIPAGDVGKITYTITIPKLYTT